MLIPISGPGKPKGLRVESALKPAGLESRLRSRSGSRRCALWWIAVAFCASSLSAARASGLAERFPELMDTLLTGSYAAADSISGGICRDYAGHPAALYARQTVLHARLIDSEDTVGWGELFVLADSCARRCEEWRDAGREEPFLLSYLRGSALSSAGLLLLRSGKLLPGLQRLLLARQEFDAAIEQNPRFYDAYLGRGTYRCAVAQNASVLGVLPFVPDLDGGLHDLELAFDSSRWSRWVALNALGWLVLKDGNYARADSLCEIGLARFPGSRAFLQLKLSVQVQQNHWAESERVGLRLLSEHLTDPQSNGYETTTLYWRLMVCADSLGRPDDAAEYARLGLAVRRSPDVEQRRKGKVAAMRERLSRVSAMTGDESGGR
jgi:tetratricopeptide (TPR) repeat protein